MVASKFLKMINNICGNKPLANINRTNPETIKDVNIKQTSLTAIEFIDVDSKENFDDLQYTCICSVVNKVLFYGRLFGISPIIISRHDSGKSPCKYLVSTIWIIYGIIIQMLYSGYVLIMYYSRITCGPSGQPVLEWYVMTLGYFVTDLDSVFALFMGTLFAKRTAKLLNQLAVMPGFIQTKVYNLEKRILYGCRYLLLAFAIVLCSYIYVASLRSRHRFRGSYHCTMSGLFSKNFPWLVFRGSYILERPFAVILRGLTIVIPTAQIAIVMTLILVIESKFLILAKSTVRTLNNTNEEAKRFGNLLERLSTTHKDITLFVKELNNCMGFQSLVAISSSLYNTIYYLYRYNTATDYGLTSNYDERVHYIVGLLYRTGKLLVYMFLGQLLTTSSMKPLDILQSNSIIINLPSRQQQQIHTLILQWSGKRNSFSAVGVINIGPWLLAPMIGNIITYLLVAIQFQQIKP